MSYLISKGVPAETASTVLVNIALASASESQIRTLQDEIERDINGGTPPARDGCSRGRLLEAMSAAGTLLLASFRARHYLTRGTRVRRLIRWRMVPCEIRGRQSGAGAHPPAPRGKDNKRPPRNH
jgi:hypothetical protein